MTRRVILDVSSNNGNVNFAALRQAHPEVGGAIVKATEGGSYVNPLFNSQIAAARGAGLLVGAYGFMHPSVAGTGDDSLFERVAGLGPLPLGMWLDCEVTDGLNPATVLSRFLEDAAEFDRHYAGHDGIYTGRWFWDPDTSGSIPAHVERWPLWVSGYVSNFSPSLLPIPWTSCLLWQFTSNYFGTGIDASVFMGDDAAWARWTGSSAPPPAPQSVDVRKIQGAVHAVQDGVWGPDTDRRCELVRHRGPNTAALQLVLGVTADGAWGPITQGAYTTAVKLIQEGLHIAVVDGAWGPVTDAAYLAASPLR